MWIKAHKNQIVSFGAALFVFLVCFSFLSFAVPVEVVYPVDKPSAQLFFWHDDNNIPDVFTPTTQSQGSGFLNNAVFKPSLPSGTPRANPSQLIEFTYPYDCDFYLGSVYQIEVIVHNAIWSSSLDFDPSGVLFSLSAKYPTTQHNSTINKIHLEEYYPWFFAPSAVSHNNSRWVLTYNVPFYASNFDGWLPVDQDNKVVCSTFAFYDDSDSLAHSFVISDGQLVSNYRFGLYSVSVKRMTEAEALAWAVDNNTKAISQAISAQTVAINDKIEDQVDRIISGDELPSDPSDRLSEVADLVNTEFEEAASMYDSWFNADFSMDQLTHHIEQLSQSTLAAGIVYNDWFEYTLSSVSFLKYVIPFILIAYMFFATLRLLF